MFINIVCTISIQDVRGFQTSAAHSIVEALCDKAKLIGAISSIQEIYKKKLKESVLIGKIVETGELRRTDGLLLRDSFEPV